MARTIKLSATAFEGYQYLLSLGPKRGASFVLEGVTGILKEKFGTAASLAMYAALKRVGLVKPTGKTVPGKQKKFKITRVAEVEQRGGGAKATKKRRAKKAATQRTPKRRRKKMGARRKTERPTMPPATKDMTVLDAFNRLRELKEETAGLVQMLQKLGFEIDYTLEAKLL